jgi:hypothetical protein
MYLVAEGTELSLFWIWGEIIDIVSKSGVDQLKYM